MIPAVYILGNFNVGHGLTLYGITNTIDLCQPRISETRIIILVTVDSFLVYHYLVERLISFRTISSWDS